MLLELHQVTIGETVRNVSLTVGDGQMLTMAGGHGSGKTTLLRAVLGLIAVDGGHICIDGELLTPMSAPWFRRKTAYVPQHLSLPDGYKKVGDGRWAEMSAEERYLWLVEKAVRSEKMLLIVDEPPVPLDLETEHAANALLKEATARGATVLAVVPTGGNIILNS